MQNIFSSKANVLQFLENKISKSQIEKQFVFTISEWNDKEIILNHIKNTFNKGPIIVRSSAIGEDSIEKSDAGKYTSILGIQINNKKSIANAIESVIKSYKKNKNINKKNQILIQKQTLNSKTSGVIFTTTPNNDSPYFIINYEDTNLTDSITKGIGSNTVKIYKEISKNALPKKWKKLILAVKEIERITNNEKLDIEFAITNNSIIIFQVRPLTMIKEKISKKMKKEIKKKIRINQKKIVHYRKKLDNNSKMVFSNMTDWNPAEIIGSNPNELDYSIYDYLIMKDSWSKGRELLGYHNPKIGLMQKFCGRPYVNVNASFSSLLPSKISSKLRKKLTNYFLIKLEEDPQLHDKVEFEILFTCYDFSLKKRMKDLLNYGFTKNELKIIKNNLLEFTNRLIELTPMILKNTQEFLEILENRRKSINSGSNYEEKLSEAETLLQDCKKYGTVQFAAIARLSFVAKILLNGLPKISKIDKFQIEKFMNSISSPVSEFQNDLFELKKRKISKNEFLEKYGHLRPGTYDITVNRYDKTPEFLKNLKILNMKKLSTAKPFKKNIDSILKKHGLIFNELEFFDFVKETIYLREKSKFEFTKNLSDAIELIAASGEELGFSRKQLSQLSFSDIKKYKILKKKELKEFWKKKIQNNNKDKEITSHVELPPIFFSQDDLMFIEHYIAKPNFITEKQLISDTILLQNFEHLERITSKIVMIENADPGFDWIFTKNPAGLITKYGGMASHMAIRCAELNLPAAIGCGDILFENLKSSSKISLDCKNKDILILNYKQKNDYYEEKKLLKSLGYIK